MASSWQLSLLVILNCIIATTLMNTCISLFPPNMSDCGRPPITKYYYSANLRTCVPFTYRGCIDLFSRTFDSLQECQSECIEGTTTEPTNEPTNPPTTPPPTEPPSNFCEYRYDTGYFKLGVASSIRFYYNHTVGKCQWFRYFGNGGNANNFKTPENCTNTCGKVVVSVSTSVVPTIRKVTFEPATSLMIVPTPVDLGSGDFTESDLYSVSIKDTTTSKESTTIITSEHTTKSTSTLFTSKSDSQSFTRPSSTSSSSATSLSAPDILKSPSESVRVNDNSSSSNENVYFLYGTISIVIIMVVFCFIAGVLIIIIYVKYRRQVAQIHTRDNGEKPGPTQFLPSAKLSFSRSPCRLPSNSSSTSSASSSSRTSSDKMVPDQ